MSKSLDKRFELELAARNAEQVSLTLTFQMPVSGSVCHESGGLVEGALGLGRRDRL